MIIGTARFWLPFQGAVDEEGNTPQKKGFLDGKPLEAKFNEPMGVAFDKEGTLYVADTKNRRVRMIKYE